MKTENIVIENTRFAPGLERDNGQIQPGQVCLANESRFNSAFFSEPLTAYAAGWRDPNNIEALLDFVASPVQVGRRFEYKKADNAEAFLSEADRTQKFALSAPLYAADGAWVGVIVAMADSGATLGSLRLSDLMYDSLPAGVHRTTIRPWNHATRRERRS